MQSFRKSPFIEAQAFEQEFYNINNYLPFLTRPRLAERRRSSSSRYSSLSNNRAGCNKPAGWKNLQNLCSFKTNLVFKSHIRLFLNDKAE